MNIYALFFSAHFISDRDKKEKDLILETEVQDTFKIFQIYGEDIEAVSVNICQEDTEFYGTYSEENVPEDGYKATEKITLTEDLSVEENDYLLDTDDLLDIIYFSNKLDVNKHMQNWNLDLTSHNFIVFYMKNGWEIWVFIEKGTVEIHSGMKGYITEFGLNLSGEYKEMWEEQIVSYFFKKYDIK